MRFSDDDLARVEADLVIDKKASGAWYAPLTRKELDSLLSRLKAAEQCLESSAKAFPIFERNLDYQAWKKSKGEGV